MSISISAPQKRVTQAAQASPSQEHVTQAFQDEWVGNLTLLKVRSSTEKSKKNVLKQENQKRNTHERCIKDMFAFSFRRIMT